MKRRNVRDLLLTLGLAAACLILIPGSTRAGFNDLPTSWSHFSSPTTFGYNAAYTDGGLVIADYEIPDVTYNISLGGKTEIDLASGSATSAPGPYPTVGYGYYDGGTPYDPRDPTSYADDFVFFRMRLAGDPTFKNAFSAYHWNVLLDVDGDGYKEYWVDVEGGYDNTGGYDRLQILWDDSNSQLVADPATARVGEFRAHDLYDGADPSKRYTHTRVYAAADGTGDYLLEIQVPLTAFIDLNGNQVLFPDSPVGFAFSTSTSNTDPLQKDWSSDFTGGLTYDPANPIRFGDPITFNGEAVVVFTDSTYKVKDFEVAGNPLYVLLTDVRANSDPATVQTTTVVVRGPTGDDELWTLTETSAASGVFRSGPIPTTTAATADLNGTLTVVAGRPAYVFYTNSPGGDTDPDNNIKRDTIDITGGTGDGYVQFTRISGLNNEVFTFTTSTSTSDPLFVTVTDSNANTDPLTVQSVSVTITSTYAGLPTDTVTITLTETGPNTGIFRNVTGVPTRIYSTSFSASDGIIEGVDESGLTVTYVDANDGDGDPSNNTKRDTASAYVRASGQVFLQDSRGVDKEFYAVAYEGVFVTVVDYNDAGLGTLTVTVSDAVSHDSETLTLYETHLNSGIYTNRPSTPVDAAPNASISPIDVDAAALVEETWTVTYSALTANWSVTGSVSGLQPVAAVAGQLYESTTGGVSFTITQSGTPVAGESFTFLTHRALPTVESSTAAADGKLQTVDGSTITASYTDANDGDATSANDIKTDTAGARGPGVVIDEVFFDETRTYLDGLGNPATETTFEWIRIKNSSYVTTFDVTGWLVADEDLALSYVIPQVGGANVLLGPGDEIYLLLIPGPADDLYNAADGVYILHTGASAMGALDDLEDQVSLYNTSTPAWDSIVDFVAYDSNLDASLWLDQDNNAVARAIWNDLNYFDTAEAVAAGDEYSSIRRRYSGFDTDRPSDWEINWTPFAITAVELETFTAVGTEGAVVVFWRTATETQAAGFHLVRAPSPAGPWTRVGGFVPATAEAFTGASYTIVDHDAVPGLPYVYRLEAVDRDGESEIFGPVEVDWDADGMGDLWELDHGLDNLDPSDALTDSDGDGLSNVLEFAFGFDPTSADTDGDGVSDADELIGGDIVTRVGSDGPDRPGVTELSRSADSVTLMLTTTDILLQASHLTIPAYPHGAHTDPGAPLLPQKGWFVRLPEGSEARLEVLSITERDAGTAPFVGPAPRLDSRPDGSVVEVWGPDPTVYGTSVLWPTEAASLGAGGVAGDDPVVAVRFSPVAWNPVTGRLRLRERIVVRISFVPHAPAKASAAVTTTPWTPPAGSLALGVAGDGLVAVDGTALEVAGMTLGGPSTALNVVHDGSPWACLVEDGGDGTFDADDRLVFYAPPFRSKYVRDDVYFVVVDPSAPPLRVADRTGLPGDTPAEVANVSHTVHLERDRQYRYEVPGSDDEDRWYDDTVIYRSAAVNTPGVVSVVLPAPDPTAAEPATVRVRLGAIYHRPDEAPDHRIRVDVNALTDVGDLTFDGLDMVTVEGALPQTVLVDGPNTVTIRALLYGGAEVENFRHDWVELTYRRRLEAAADRFDFSALAGAWRFAIDGFASDDVTVLDVTDPSRPTRIADVATGTGALGTLATVVDHPVSPRRYLASTPAARQAPRWVRAAADATAALDTSGVDYVVLGPRAFAAAADRLVAWRTAQGLTCRFVPLEAVADAFGGGAATPDAILAFVRATAPAFLVLLGDASYDYKNNLGLVDPGNVVPTYLTSTALHGEVPWDGRYAAHAGADDLPDLALGRLPARTLAQAQTMVDKIIAYETATPSLTERRTNLLVADDDEPEFAVVAEALAGTITPLGPYWVDTLRVADYPVSSMIEPILAGAIDSGLMLLNYTGHGAPDYWADEQILRVTTVDGLTGGRLLPLVVSMACFDGAFAGASKDAPARYAACLAERLVLAPGRGAIATIANAGTSTAVAKDFVDRALVTAMYQGGTRRAGDVLRVALLDYLANYDDRENVARALVLLGDPATKLHLPAPQNPADLAVISRSSTSLVLSWTPSPDPDVAGYVLVRAAAPGAAEESLTPVPVTTTTFTVEGPAAAGGWYAVAAVRDGFQSGRAAVTAAPLSSGGGGGGGCVIGTGGANHTSVFSLLPLLLPFLPLLRRRRLRS